VALAWLMHQKPWIVPIPGTTKISHLQENMAVADIQFSSEDIREIDDAVSKITIYGDRYTPVEQSRIGN
jgi:aryl-alcohol dehydrogenase-like predicted oxidoreductase